MGKLFFDQSRPKVRAGGLKIGDTVRLRNCGSFDGMTGRVLSRDHGMWTFRVILRRGDWGSQTFNLHESDLTQYCDIINEEQ